MCATEQIRAAGFSLTPTLQTDLKTEKNKTKQKHAALFQLMEIPESSSLGADAAEAPAPASTCLVSAAFPVHVLQLCISKDN